MLQIVLLQRRHARGEPTALAAGPQAQVDRERDASRRDVAEHAGQPLDREAVEPVRVDPIGAVGRAVLGEDAEQVEVGAGDQLAPTELAQPHDDGGNELAGRIARHAVALEQRLLGQEPAGRERRLRERGHLARVAVDGRDTQDVAPDDGQLFGLLRPAQPIAPIGRRGSRREHRRHRRAEVGSGFPAQEPLGARQRREQLGLGDQQLGEEIAAGADLDEAQEQLRVHEQLDEPGARPGSREEPLELVQRLVGIGALPQGVDEHRIEALERGAHVRGVRHQRTALEDHL